MTAHKILKKAAGGSVKVIGKVSSPFARRSVRTIGELHRAENHSISAFGS